MGARTNKQLLACSVSVLLASSLMDASAHWANLYSIPGTYACITSFCPVEDGGSLLAAGYIREKSSILRPWLALLGGSGNIVWQRTYGQDDGPDSYFAEVLPAGDGGFLLFGNAVTDSGGWDAWVVKLDEFYNKVWSRTYGGAGFDVIDAAAPSGDGGSVFVGILDAPADERPLRWVVRLDASGHIVSQSTYGQIGGEQPMSILRVDDGYVIVDSSDLSGWVLKLDLLGNPIWQRAIGMFGSTESCEFTSVEAAPGGGLLISGYVLFAAGRAGLLVRLDASGTLRSALQTGGGDYAYWTRSWTATADGATIVSGMHKTSDTSRWEGWIARLRESGEVEWSRAHDLSGDEGYWRAREMKDGRLTVLGHSQQTIDAGSGLIARVSSHGDIDPSCAEFARELPVTFYHPQISVTDTHERRSKADAVSRDLRPGFESGLVEKALICGEAGGPDVTGAFTSLSLRLRGSSVRASFTCRNDGLVAAGASTVNIYFSRNPTHSWRDSLVTTVPVPRLEAGATYSFSIRGTKGRSHRYVLAQVDAERAVPEENEGNNLIASQF